MKKEISKKDKKLTFNNLTDIINYLEKTFPNNDTIFLNNYCLENLIADLVNIRAKNEKFKKVKSDKYSKKVKSDKYFKKVKSDKYHVQLRIYSSDEETDISFYKTAKLTRKQCIKFSDSAYDFLEDFLLNL